MKLDTVLTESASADDLARLLGRYYRIVTDAARARKSKDKEALHQALIKQEKIEGEIESVLYQRN